jgi:hypothetical protein
MFNQFFNLNAVTASARSLSNYLTAVNLNERLAMLAARRYIGTLHCRSGQRQQPQGQLP